MMIVRFLRTALPYLAGEVAGFDEATVARLLRQGLVERVESGVAENPAQPPLHRAQRSYKRRA
jgi:hypothetical protein